ncbi:MAG: hypothetical protein R3C14_43460 [Caldilineaceae bacterium]
MERTLSIKLPEPVFQKVQSAANHTHRTVDDIIASTLNAAFVAPSNLPTELANELAAMHQAKDSLLWEALRPFVTSAQRDRLQRLNEWSNERKLTEVELEEQRLLLLAHQFYFAQSTGACDFDTARLHSV